MKYLLDTDTLIYYFAHDSNIIAGMKTAGYRNLYTTCITQGELFFGAYYSIKKEENLRKLRHFFTRIKRLPITDEVIEKFGEMKALLISTGRKVTDHDIWIGSFGKAYNMTVVTNNEKHFRRFRGVKIKNWKNKKTTIQINANLDN